jgi:aminopeptidase N
MRHLLLGASASALLFLSSCSENPSAPVESSKSAKALQVAEMNRAMDGHSHSRPNEARVTHLDWKASVDFETQIITGTATYDIASTEDASRILFDMKGLNVASVLVDGQPVPFTEGPERPFVGQSLNVPISHNAQKVSINYTSSPDAGALLWVEGDEPFLFTQSQAILARTWLPCQDSPGVRFTYDAEVSVPEGLMALMSAENPVETSPDGIYRFKMDSPIPSYLMALAVGDVEFRALGERTGVYAVPSLIEKAAWEFEEMESLLLAAEELYGPYAWGRYDLLVLPAAFPFGGMENPRLTFATPTIIAGDRSLVALVAHELAHSWSGNLVTNATWNDFWLNEGFTVYFEQRIMEAVYGAEISEMLATLSYQGLVDEVDAIMDLNPDDTHLKLHLENRDPDDGMTAIAYDKGYFFLRMLEEAAGRPAFDSFLKTYFSEHSFRVMDTEGFMVYLNETLLADADVRAKVNVDEWVYGPGLPENCPQVGSARIEKVDELLQRWEASETTTSDLPWGDWVYQEKYRFLSNIADDMPAERLAELDQTWNITNTGNNEVLFAWLEQGIRSHYTPCYDRLRAFLVEIGRRKFLTPLYRAMLESDQKEMALAIYSEARANYHSVATGTMDALLGINEAQ